MKTLAPSDKTVTTRDPKGLKFSSIVDAAYNKAELSEEEAQRVNDTPGLSNLIGTFIADSRSPNKFKDEERASSYGYLSGYKPKSLHDQTNDLRKLFPGLKVASPSLFMQADSGEVALPANAEGWFAIPNWIKNPQIFGATYNEALQKVLDKIKETRKGKFTNWRDGQIGPERLRQLERTQEFFRQLSEAQGNPDILLVPAQFGIRHRGRSVRRAREVFLGNEFGLGAFAVGIMILTHSERLQHYDDLWIDCAGDEYDDPDSVVRFGDAPYFSFDGDGVEFVTRFAGYAIGYYGSASGFSPQK